MKKVLKIEYLQLPKELTSPNSNIIWRIVEQSHRVENFGDGCATWEASNGVILQSLETPGWYGERSVFVRGGLTILDSFLVTMPEEFFQRFLLAVREYNATEFPEPVKG